MESRTVQRHKNDEFELESKQQDLFLSFTVIKNQALKICLNLCVMFSSQISIKLVYQIK